MCANYYARWCHSEGGIYILDRGPQLINNFGYVIIGLIYYVHVGITQRNMTQTEIVRMHVPILYSSSGI